MSLSGYQKPTHTLLSCQVVLDHINRAQAHKTPSPHAISGVRMLRRRCAGDGALSAGSCLRDAELAWVTSALRALGQRASAAGLQRAAQANLTVALMASTSRALAHDSAQVRPC